MRIFKFIIPVFCVYTLSACAGPVSSSLPEGQYPSAVETPRPGQTYVPGYALVIGPFPTGYAGQNRGVLPAQ